MRIAVTGLSGQIVRAMQERAPSGVLVLPLGRPVLDLDRSDTIGPAIIAARPDLVVNAAAWTAVDQAEQEPAAAMRVNGAAAGDVARAAAATGAPLIQLSTDYVFDGTLDRPYRENDAVAPVSAYGTSKLAGEQAVAAVTDDHVILRTAWLHAPFGSNFIRTMLRLAETRPEVSVVADQLGCPTSALDVADGVFTVGRNLLAWRGDSALRGVFHIAASGEASWADVAEAVFAERARLGAPVVTVRRITSAEYPTPARRPSNSRLDCSLLGERHGITLPEWRSSVSACVTRLVAAAGTARHG